MRIAYFDCFSGASGDMLLASLLDAGLSLAELQADLARLPVGGYRLSVERVTRRGLTGTHLRVLPRLGPPHEGGKGLSPHGPPHEGGGGLSPLDPLVARHEAGEERPARTLPAIETIMGGSDLPERVRVRSLAVFRRLARVEAAIHGTTVDQIHFHEIGAVDSLADIVGFASALERLGVEAVYCSALPLGGGTVQTEHGLLPAPAPATLALLAEVGAPTLPGPVQAELVTPTGAALLAEFAAFHQPPMAVRQVGYGFGTKEFDFPNALRVWLGDSLPAGGVAAEGDVVQLACNLDDSTGEALGYTMERLFAGGALDVWFTPIQMKKNRPAVMLSALVRPEDADALANLILRETATLGVRQQRLARTTAGRELCTVDTPWGPVRVKVKILDGQAVGASPEYDDCARIAAATGVPLARVMAYVAQASDIRQASDV